ncbi:MAG: NAD(P)/FAD-dependent oxidoreductase [Thermoproteota archaeon]
MRLDCDSLIVGGGPSGLLTGSTISKNGFRTVVLEEHSEVGSPEQCTGLVSWRIGEVPQHLVLNTVKTARFCFRGKSFEVSSKRRMLVIDRKGYDKHLAEKAVEEGVEIRLGERVVRLKGGSIVTSMGNHYSGRILVGADGPNSIVARLTGLKQPKNLLFGLQCVANGVFEQDIVELMFDPEFSKDAFAWIVPLSRSKARIGLLTQGDPLPRIRLLLRKLNMDAEKTKFVGDSIRFGIMDKTVADNVILVGDAACQVKPFSLGGLVYSRVCSKIAGDACVAALKENVFNESFLAEKYDLRWRTAIEAALRKGLRVRKIFSVMKRMPVLFTLIRGLGLDLLASRFLDPDFLEDDID